MRQPINPYAKFAQRDLSLNDHLAIDRTVLANERTLLAYGRTSLAMLIIGGSAIKFFDSITMAVIGVPFIIGGIVVILWGWMRYHRTQRFLSVALEHRTGSPDHPLTRQVDRGERDDDDDSKPDSKKDKDKPTWARPEESSER